MVQSFLKIQAMFHNFIDSFIMQTVNTIQELKHQSNFLHQSESFLHKLYCCVKKSEVKVYFECLLDPE